ncbi:putative leader peptide [Kitasatospora sp. NPDC050463]|uniref:putative leader peptide n=1 Tax=Kitasatospora sp. NPDC050463 TaxID=3155786 RepID=UPI0033F0391F
MSGMWTGVWMFWTAAPWGCEPPAMLPAVNLVARRHIDLLRVSSCCCARGLCRCC